MIALLRLHCRTRDCRIVAALAAVFVALHLPFMASTLADIDSVNLALGVQDFDPAQHRPHPPGYPIFIALGKIASTVLDAPRALAVWGVIFGAVAAFALWRLFEALEQMDRGSALDGAGAGRETWAPVAVAGSAVTLSAPLFWLNASRPMTDVAGLAAAVVAQAVLVAALAAQQVPAGGPSGDRNASRRMQSGRLILAGAFLSALAIGVRSQAVWLTLPLLAFVLVDRAGRDAVGALIGSAVWFAAGALLWVVPLLVASGGPAAYWAAFRNQAGEDWHGANILATHPGVRELARSLVDTFIRPWDSYLLGGLVLALAAAGALAQWRPGRKRLLALAAIALPYGAFHLLFQETPHTRYALPLVPVVGYLAVQGLAAAGRWPLVAGASAIVAVSVAMTQPKLVLYARTGSPSARALADIRAQDAAARSTRVPSLALSLPVHIAWRGQPMARTRTVMRGLPPSALASRWSSGSPEAVWYVTEPGPNDLDLPHELARFDPAARRLLRSYRWPFDPTNLLGGVRPSDIDWWELRPPGWIALEGWSLTPQLAGHVLTAGAGLAQGGLEALVRRRRGPVNVLVGGRNLGTAGAPAVAFTLAVDGVDRESWTVDPVPGFFLETWTWPDGIGPGTETFAMLTIRAEARDADGREPAAALEQFDLQPPGNAVVGFGDGWHEQEYDPDREILWRWSSGRASVRVLGVARDTVLRVRGEAPSRYFPRSSHVVVAAGSRVLFEADVAEDYDWTISVPAAALAEAGGEIVLTTDQTFSPADRGESADGRALGLRIFSVSLTPVS